MNKEVLIKQVATAMELPEDTVFKVIAFQGEDALKAVKIHDELEFSGFGKFYLSQTKLKRYLSNMYKGIEKAKLNNNTEKIEILTGVVENLNKRVK